MKKYHSLKQFSPRVLFAFGEVTNNEKTITYLEYLKEMVEPKLKIKLTEKQKTMRDMFRKKLDVTFPEIYCAMRPYIKSGKNDRRVIASILACVIDKGYAEPTPDGTFDFY